jgi:hypothetical protein
MQLLLVGFCLGIIFMYAVAWINSNLCELKVKFPTEKVACTVQGGLENRKITSVHFNEKDTSVYYAKD